MLELPLVLIHESPVQPLASPGKGDFPEFDTRSQSLDGSGAPMQLLVTPTVFGLSPLQASAHIDPSHLRLKNWKQRHVIVAETLKRLQNDVEPVPVQHPIFILGRRGNATQVSRHHHPKGLHFMPFYSTQQGHVRLDVHVKSRSSSPNRAHVPGIVMAFSPEANVAQEVVAIG